jgi:hypothetical protein
MYGEDWYVALVSTSSCAAEKGNIPSSYVSHHVITMPSLTTVARLQFLPEMPSSRPNHTPLPHLVIVARLHFLLDCRHRDRTTHPCHLSPLWIGYNSSLLHHRHGPPPERVVPTLHEHAQLIILSTATTLPFFLHLPEHSSTTFYHTFWSQGGWWCVTHIDDIV